MSQPSPPPSPAPRSFAPASSPFSPPEQGWVSVSPRLATVRRVINMAVNGAIGAIGVAALAIWVDPVWAAVAAVGVVAFSCWEWWLIGRQVKAIGYAERDDDLVVTQGIMFKSLVVVPYGRMQLVDLTAGPLDRRNGIATLQLHTAAATTDAIVPGLPLTEAERMRDRLAALGEARSAGL